MSISKFYEWFQTVPGAADYMPARGVFYDSTELAARRVAVIRQQPGRRPTLEIEFPHIQLILMGVRDGRSVPGELLEIENFAEAVSDHAFAVPGTDCLIQINRLGSIMGPNYTAEDRPMYVLNFELIK